MSPALEAQNGGADNLPNWLNAGLFEDLLRSEMEDYQKIKKFSAKSALSAGENYLSLMLRIHIQVQLRNEKSRTVAYMLKTTPHSEEAKLMGQAMSVFAKESTMYHEILPKFEALYRHSGVERKLAPTSFHLKHKPNVDCILLDDMQPKGYKNVNRLDGLDMKHCKAVLEKLAAFHAASAVHYDHVGSVPTIYTKPPLTEEQLILFEEKNTPSNRKFHESLRSYNLREFEDKIKSYLKSMPQMYSKIDKIDPLEFNVLLHGDCWSNNILFQYDAFGNIKDTVFVDFQISQYGSPARDLLYFILTSACFADKLKYFDFYIKHYHDHLMANLKLLKYTKAMPKLTDLHLAILKYSCWGFVAIMKILPIVLLDPSANADMDKIMGDDSDGYSMLDLMYGNPRYAKQIEEILPWMETRGLLED